MAPRKTQHRASASARRGPGDRSARVAPSRRTSATQRLRNTSTTPSAKRVSERKGAAGADATHAKSTRNREPKSTARDRRRWWLLPVFVLAAITIFVLTYYPVAKVQYRATRERARLRAELKAIQARNDRLRATVTALATPEGVEDYARSQLGMVRKGEHVVIVVDGDQRRTRSQSPTEALIAPRIDSQEAVNPAVGPWTAFLDSVFGVQ